MAVVAAAVVATAATSVVAIASEESAIFTGATSRKLFVPNPAVFEEGKRRGKSSFTFPAGAPAVPLTWWRHDARRGPRLRPCRCHRPW